jgi:hypothetical protein
LLQVPAALLTQRLAAIAPLVKNGSVDGLDFGDELVTPFSNISSVIAAARQALGPKALLYLLQSIHLSSQSVTLPLFLARFMIYVCMF